MSNYKTLLYFFTFVRNDNPPHSLLTFSPPQTCPLPLSLDIQTPSPLPVIARPLGRSNPLSPQKKSPEVKMKNFTHPEGQSNKIKILKFYFTSSKSASTTFSSEPLASASGAP